jgi:predicted nuclease of predicted toxin-antitoxin system
VNLLIDENLSPMLVQLLAAKHVAASHVAHLGMAGASDPEVWKHAFEHDQIVITINAADFLHLARSVQLHPGLVVLRAGVGLSRDEQWAWVEPVIDWLIAMGEPLVNRAVIVTGKGKFTCTDLPEP